VQAEGRATRRSLRLRSMEHVKEDRHAEATKRLNERREQHDRGNQIPQDIEKVEDEPPEQKSCYQSRPDQGQQRRIFKCHGRSMSVAGVHPQLRRR